MKRILLLLLFSFSVLLSGCMIEYYDETYYGVAEYITISDKEVLVANLGPLGIVNIPQDISVVCYEPNQEAITNYSIVEGDLIRFWFNNLGEISIQESFPGNFSSVPTSIDVSLHGLKMAYYDRDHYKLSFPISYLPESPADESNHYSVTFSNNTNELMQADILVFDDESFSILLVNDDVISSLYFISAANIFTLKMNENE
ncbi:MAG: hypothetical protein AB7U79_03010 [Candidatus Izemoplasmatales bacterium]